MANKKETSMAGWIKIGRDITNHWIWTDPERLKWWLDMQLMASWEDREVMHDSHVFTLRTGQLIASEKFLARRWGRSRPTIKRFLCQLKQSGMISRETLYRQTAVITICNYGYCLPAKDTGVDTLADSMGSTIVDTNKRNKRNKEHLLKKTEDENRNIRNQRRSTEVMASSADEYKTKF